MRYELDADGLTVTHGARNLSERSRSVGGRDASVPPDRGDARSKHLTLTAPAATYFVVDERLNPVAEMPVTPEVDLRGGRDRRRTSTSTPPTARSSMPTPSDGRGDIAWLEAPDGSRTTLWQGLDWGYLQVFTTDLFPRQEGHGRAVAVEPMTAPPDALNSGAGRHVLDARVRPGRVRGA